MKRLIMSVGGVLCSLNVALAATTITVDPTAPEETETTVRTIEAAFEKLSSDGSAILVRPGTYYLTQPLTNKVKNLVFRSADAATGEIDRENTVIDGSRSGARAFYSAKSAPTVDGFTFRNFRIKGSGGALALPSGNGAYRVQNCIFSDNEATNGSGGAIYSYLNNGGVISNCVFCDNHVLSTSDSTCGGGAVYTMQNGEGSGDAVSMFDCCFTNNYVDGVGTAQGGAVYGQRAIHLRRCQFVGGWVYSSKHASSGGILCVGGGASVRDCSFTVWDTKSHDKGTVLGRILFLGRGGAATPAGGSHTVEGCTFGPVENIGTSGNGLVYSGSEVTSEKIFNCTFRGLKSALKPFDLGSAVISGRMRNCLFADNTSTGILGAGGAGSTWTYENCTFIGPADGAKMTGAKVSTFVNCLSNCTTPEGATVTTSLFAGSIAGCGFVRGGSDYRLAAASPAVDVGTALDWHEGATDIAGRPRVVNTVDIGAYERQADDPEKFYVRAVATAEDKTGAWEDAYVGIQPAFEAAQDGDEVLVKAGTYRLTEALNLQDKILTVKGAGIDETVVDAQGKGRCLVAVVTSAGTGSLFIDGFTFANGCAGDDTSAENYRARGGGVYLSCTPSAFRIALSNCRVTGCRALQPLSATGTIPDQSTFQGAGLFAEKYCTFTGCRFDDNVASNTYGAAAYVYPAGTANVRDAGMFFSDCVISNCSNVGKEGSAGSSCAGLYAGSNAPLWIENTVFASLKGNKYNNALQLYPNSTVTNCIIRSCQCSYSLVHCQSGASKFIDCKFDDNTGYSVLDASAQCERCVFKSNNMIWFQGGPSVARNCLFTKTYNTVVQCQGTSNIAATFEGCTFADNANANVFVFGTGSNVSATFRDCIFWGNKADLADSSGSATHTATLENCLLSARPECVAVTDTDCIYGKSPKFVDAENGDYRLKRSSPARDKALKLSWMTVEAIDLARNPRVVTDTRTLAEDPNALPDIGCYENMDRRPGLVLLVW